MGACRSVGLDIYFLFLAQDSEDFSLFLTSAINLEALDGRSKHLSVTGKSGHINLLPFYKLIKPRFLLGPQKSPWYFSVPQFFCTVETVALSLLFLFLFLKEWHLSIQCQ